MRSKRVVLSCVALVAAVAVGGCGSSGTNNASTPTTSTTSPPQIPTSPSMPVSPSTPTGMPDMVGISIQNFTFAGPAAFPPGQMILVTNRDSAAHTLTSDTAGLFDVTVDPNGGTAMFDAPTKPGRYPYHCSYHSSMHGTLVVK